MSCGVNPSLREDPAEVAKRNATPKPRLKWKVVPNLPKLEGSRAVKETWSLHMNGRGAEIIWRNDGSCAEWLGDNKSCGGTTHWRSGAAGIAVVTAEAFLEGKSNPHMY